MSARYTYDAADRVTGVTMGTRGQTRTFDYDGRGFLLSEQHPELGWFGNERTYYLDYDPLGHPGVAPRLRTTLSTRHTATTPRSG